MLKELTADHAEQWADTVEMVRKCIEKGDLSPCFDSMNEVRDLLYVENLLRRIQRELLMKQLDQQGPNPYNN